MYLHTSIIVYKDGVLESVLKHSGWFIPVHRGNRWWPDLSAILLGEQGVIPYVSVVSHVLLGTTLPIVVQCGPVNGTWVRGFATQ